ncbi:hypothetical protein QFC21_004019 [Naganishia friedmannii]|uniref:Uncharacterized protein n=1 Tax=Naganishia friedmannii TaxID=89922 RepID=A0ACC2VJ79_9TREE|nr:hypothetical protein QFC21_004019 [Naganishia friedmannii]
MSPNYPVAEIMDLTLKPTMWQNTLVPSPLESVAKPQADYCFPLKTDQYSPKASLTLRPKFRSADLLLSPRNIPSRADANLSERDGRDEITLIVDEMDGFDPDSFDREMAKLAQEGRTCPSTPLHEKLEPEFSPRQWWGDVGKRSKYDRFTDVDLHTSTSITMIDSDLNASRRGSQLLPGIMGALVSGSNTRRSSACVPVQLGRRPSGTESFAEVVRQRASVSFAPGEEAHQQGFVPPILSDRADTFIALECRFRLNKGDVGRRVLAHIALGG